VKVLLHTSVSLIVVALVTTGCRDTAAREGTPEIAVTNSYLECVVKDLCGPDMRVLCLAPPGMCPGHFDISPAQVRQLRNCRVLLLFDFQQQVEQKLARLRENGLKTQLIRAPSGLCVPDTYMATCKEVCRALSSEYPEKASQFAERLSVADKRLERLAAELQGSVIGSGIVSARVLTSNHQAEFAQWLGLKPVATFIGSDLETVANIDHCLQKAAGQDIRLVIANQQEGTALAEALAERLGARVVVFSNFPQACEGVGGFDRLLRDNVRLVLEAVAR
jgi:ABC-type Zn uptake system ZnuABC Zn-binding protein ZnuA